MAKKTAFEIKTLHHLPRYKQSTADFACGPVSICICLDYLLTRMGLQKLDYTAIKKIELLTMDGRTWSSRGTSYESMKIAIRRMGFRCREIQGKTDDEKKENLQRAISRSNPVILGCIAKLGRRRYRHYVVLKGIDREHIHIRDPYPKGRPSKVPIKEFRKNGKPTSWGNNRWGIEVYYKSPK